MFTLMAMAQHRMTAVGARALLPGYWHYVTVYILIHLGTVHFFEVGGAGGIWGGGGQHVLEDP